MHRLPVTSVLFMLLLFAACSDSSYEATAPDLSPESRVTGSDWKGASTCRSHLMSISDACVWFYAEHTAYPQALTDLGSCYANMRCPSCGLPYVFRSSETSFAVACPSQHSVVNHGHTVNGMPSWSTSYNSCRSTMRAIASYCVIYFAENSEYPDSLADLGEVFADLRCPCCLDEEYVYYSYSGGQEFFIECPLPGDENHGHIDNGIASWPQW